MTKLTDKNRLSVVNPELCKEWDYEKNGELKPENFSHGSDKKAWWRCSKNHKWQAKISKRCRGEDCPYCSGRRLSDDNRLSLINPELCEEWDYEKNNSLSPSELSYGSSKKVWWKCKNGHSWLSKVNSKNKYNIRGVYEKKKWPYCCNQIICKDNSLEAKNPELAKEWHLTKNGYLTPKDVFPNSRKKYWWICLKRHEWQARADGRNNGVGCPLCSKIELKDGTSWDSMTEAYVYLKFKKKGFKIEPHKKYGTKMGKSSCDFYLPEYNTYIEVTSFTDKARKDLEYFWEIYQGRINNKINFVKEVLNKELRFIEILPLNAAQNKQVRKEMK